MLRSRWPGLVLLSLLLLLLLLHLLLFVVFLVLLATFISHVCSFSTVDPDNASAVIHAAQYHQGHVIVRLRISNERLGRLQKPSADLSCVLDTR